MSDNDFDDGLPSFFGGKNRTGYRQMAANIIDPASFATRKRENAATGETVTLRTKGGMHRVEVIPGDSVKKFEVPLISKFVATPSSKRYSGGYTPPAMPAYPGPFSEWKNWHAKSTPPDPESAASSSRLIPVALFDDAVPGAMTWYSDAFTIGGKKVVLSWRGNNLRAGIYDQPGGDYTLWKKMPSNCFGVTYPADHAGFDTFVWLSDKIRVDTGVAVHAAALRKIGSTTYLYVISGHSVFRGVVKPFITLDGQKILNAALNGTSVAMALLGTASVPHPLSQVPFINASGTKAVLFHSPGAIISDFPLGAGDTPRWAVAELDLDTLAVTPVFSNKCEFNDFAYSTSESYSNGVQSLRSSRSGQLYLDVDLALCADYKGDELVYVHLQFTKNYSTSSLSFDCEFSETSSPSENPFSNYSLTRVHSIASESFKLIHSKIGVLLKENDTDAEGSTPTTRSETGSVSRRGDGYYGSLTRSMTGGGTSVTFEWFPAVLNADLRHDYVLFAFRKTVQTAFGSISETTVYTPTSTDRAPIWAPGLTETTTSVYTALVGKTQLFKVEQAFGTAKTVQPVVVGTGSEWFWKYLATSPTTASVNKRYEGGPTSYVVATMSGNREKVCPTVAHVCVAPDGDAAYLNLVWPETDFEPGFSRAGFVLKKANSGFIQKSISDYVPGDTPALCGAIFYPNYLKA